MKVVLDVGLPGAAIAIMAAVRLGMEARHFQEVWRRKGWLYRHGVAKTTIPTWTVQTSPLLQ